MRSIFFPPHPPLTMKGRGGLKRPVPVAKKEKASGGIENSVKRTESAEPSSFPATGLRLDALSSEQSVNRILASKKEETIFFFNFTFSTKNIHVVCSWKWLFSHTGSRYPIFQPNCVVDSLYYLLLPSSQSLVGSSPPTSKQILHPSR